MHKTLRYGLFLVAAITVVNTAFALVARLISRELPESQWLRLFAVILGSLLSALVIALMVITTTPVLREWLLTYRRLFRLQNMNHPLLVRLSREAPGTFHHTLLISDLAAKAAKAIGSDAQLTRIAGYFHDIGKVISPEYYVENQKGQNPHDAMGDPIKSAAILISHVKEGISLGKKHGLPQEILDCIAQHHGTLVLKRFFEQAKEAKLDVKSSQFRYPGPRPLSREAALLMLADNAEARVRALSQKTPRIIKDTIEEAISERYKEKQLALCRFSDADFIKIRDSFTETLVALHHRRVPFQQPVSLATHVPKHSDTKQD